MAMPPPPPLPTSQSRLEEGFRPGGPPPDEPVPIFIVFMDVINTVTHIVLGAVAFFALTLVNLIQDNNNSNNNLPKLTAHVYLTIIGYTLLMSQALFSLKPQSGFANNLKYPQKTKLSWLIQLLGSILVIVGCIMPIVLIEELNRPISIPGIDIDDPIEDEHFVSGHAIVGFIAMILATVSMVGAIAHLFNKNLENNTLFKALQSCVLTVTLVLASIAICLMLDILRLDDTSSKTGMAFSILAIVGVFFMMVCNLAKGAMPSPPLMSQPVSKEELRPGSPPPEEPTPRFVIYMNVTNTVTQILLGGAAFCAFNVINFIGKAEGLYFSQHGYLIIIGYTLLLSQAIFLLNPQSGWANNIKYPKKTKLFWLIQMLGSTLVFIGCVMGVRFTENSRPHKNHLKSAHAIIGLITMILCFLCMVGGCVRLFTKNKENNSIVNALRACGVTMTLALTSISICLGLFRGHHYIYLGNQLDDSTVRMGMALSIITLIAMVFMMVCKMIRSRNIMI